MISKPRSYERFTCEDLQTDFILAQKYVPRTQSIFVFLNGIALDPDNDFIEVDSSTIKIVEPCSKGDVVIVSHLKHLSPNIRIGTGDIVGNKVTSLFKKYDKEQRLLPNQEYIVTVHIFNKDNVFKFSSCYNPFYSTSKIIRNDLLSVLKDVNDNVIDFGIWNSSNEVSNVAKVDFIDKIGKPTTAARQWVRYNTEINLVNTIYREIATHSGSVKKDLGELSIERTIKLPYLDDLLADLKKKLAKEENLLTGVFTLGRATRKADSTNYPVGVRRSF